jgi:hypothetical protein
MARDDLIWFDIDVFQDALDGAIGEMETAVKSAIYSTMSKVRRHARTLLSTMVREKWNIKKGDLDKRIKVRIGSRNGRHYESFEMTIKGTSVSLAYFGAKQYAGNRVITRTTGRQNQRRSKFQGVEVEVLKGSKTKLTGAWLQYIPGWGVAVRRREGKGRNTARIQKVISPASMIRQQDAKTADRFEEAIFSYIERTFEHELSWRLNQAGLI